MLKCEVCGFESKTQIVDHIEEKHADLKTDDFEGVLDWYMAEYDADIEDVVAPDKAKTTKGERKVSKPSSDKVAKILNVELPIQSGHEEYVPEINEAYVFNDFCDDLCNDILEEKKVMLVGHTGCGKTSVIEQIAARTKQGRIKVNMNQQTTYSDFIGTFVVQGGEMKWIDGVLPRAMKEGLWLIIDEFDMAEANILAALNPVLEPKGRLVIKEKGFEVVKPHPNFRIFATSNAAGCMADFRAMYQGTNIMNEATLDRFRVFHVGYPPPEQEVEILCKTVPRMKEQIAGVIVKVANMVREAFNNEEIQCTFSLRRVIEWSEMMIRHKTSPQAPLIAGETTIFSKVSREDAETIKGIITRVMIGQSK